MPFFELPKMDLLESEPARLNHASEIIVQDPRNITTSLSKNSRPNGSLPLPDHYLEREARSPLASGLFPVLGLQGNGTLKHQKKHGVIRAHGVSNRTSDTTSSSESAQQMTIGSKYVCAVSKISSVQHKSWLQTGQSHGLAWPLCHLNIRD